ncbi:MAG: hypothetical protein OEY59_10690 [Deltaproteobacteria bacterium]|nr:hypothetical protein [Deltaproteobacteria bacterium]
MTNLTKIIKKKYRLLSLIFLIIGAVSLLLASCSEDSVTGNCVDDLDNRRYDLVTSNPNCSTYQKASAHLGLAGFSFTNFLSPDALNNPRVAVGISESSTQWAGSVEETNYTEALRLTGDGSGDVYQDQTRDTKNIEIHFFANVGAIISQAYIEIDTLPDGQLAPEETQAFSKIRSSTDPYYGLNDIQVAPWFQFTHIDGTVYLLDFANTDKECYVDTAKTYDGVWNNTAAQPILNCGILTQSDLTTAITDNPSAPTVNINGSCDIVAQVNDIQNLFTDTITPSNSVLAFADNYLLRIADLEADLVSLGQADNEEFTNGINDFKTKIDNGATCNNPVLSEINQIVTMIEASSEIASTDGYQTKNLLSFDQVSSAADTAIIQPSFSQTLVDPNTSQTVTVNFSCTNAATLGARLIFQKDDSSYIPYYSDAKPAIGNTFNGLKYLSNDSNGQPKPDVIGDSIVSLKELICAGDAPAQ